jgi:hypothetical protein
VIRLLRLLRSRRETLETEQFDALASAQSEALLLLAASSPESPRRGRHLALPDGRLCYRFKRPLLGGRDVLVLQPNKLLRRLATLVPPPRRHLVRYHGIFGPNAAWRAEIVPRLPQPGAVDGQLAQPELPPATPLAPDPAAERGAPARRTRIPWSELLLRVFREDFLDCPCGGRRVVLAFVNDEKRVKKILDHLGLPTTGPPLAPAQRNESPEFAVWQDDVPELQHSLR